MLCVKYLTMHKAHMHAGAIRQLLYGCAYVREIIHSLKLVDYHPVHAHKPYNNLHLKELPYNSPDYIHVCSTYGTTCTIKIIKEQF